MKKRNKEPYIDIINLKEEQKEYANLCNSKSKKFKTYTAWESHIKAILLEFNSPSELYNFKRYCINQDRVLSNAPNLFGSYIIFAISILLNNINPFLPIIGIIAFILYLVYYIIKQHKSIIQESCFFKDIVEIIEKIEEEKTES